MMVIGLVCMLAKYQVISKFDHVSHDKIIMCMCIDYIQTSNQYLPSESSSLGEQLQLYQIHNYGKLLVRLVNKLFMNLEFYIENR